MIDKFQKINLKFDKGTFVNQSSLESAISAAQKSKNWQEQLAFIVRVIINDHVFADGNKRTAAAFIMAVLESCKLPYDEYKIDKMVLSIAKNQISDIVKIRRMIQNVLH